MHCLTTTAMTLKVNYAVRYVLSIPRSQPESKSSLENWLLRSRSDSYYTPINSTIVEIDLFDVFSEQITKHIFNVLTLKVLSRGSKNRVFWLK